MPASELSSTSNKSMHLKGPPENLDLSAASLEAHDLNEHSSCGGMYAHLSGELKPGLHRLFAYWPLISGAEPYSNETRAHVLMENAMLQIQTPEFTKDNGQKQTGFCGTVRLPAAPTVRTAEIGSMINRSAVPGCKPDCEQQPAESRDQQGLARWAC